MFIDRSHSCVSHSVVSSKLCVTLSVVLMCNLNQIFLHQQFGNWLPWKPARVNGQVT